MNRAGSHRPRWPCPRCGKMVTQVVGGNAAAHKCPHGKPCVLPKFVKVQPVGCAQCAKGNEVQVG